MSLATPQLRELAAKLIAEGGAGEGGAERVCVRLGELITKLTGPAGWRSLISRALVLARSEVPALADVSVLPDGKVEGLAKQNDGGVALVAELLGLLHTFIGERMTMQLILEAWPELPGDGMSPKQPTT